MSELHEWSTSLKPAHVRAWYLASVPLYVGFAGVTNLAPAAGWRKWVFYALYLVLCLACPTGAQMARFVMRRDNPPLWTMFFFLSAALSVPLALACAEGPPAWQVALFYSLSVAALAHAPAAVAWSRRGAVSDVFDS